MKSILPLERQLYIAYSNLNPNFIPYIRRSHIKSFEDLTDEGKKTELNLEEIKNYKGPPNPSLALVKNAAWTKKSFTKSEQKNNSVRKDEVSAIKNSDSAIKNTPKQPKPQPKNIDLADMPNINECFKCRQLGHTFKDCVNEAKYRIFCFSCGKGKVTSPKCPNCKNRVKKNE